MTREEAVKEIEKAFEPAFTNYIITALTEGATASDKEPTTKNDDTVSRKAVHDMLENLPITVEDKWFNWLQKACMRLAELPSVTPQEPQTFKWCTNCKEYDQEKHCCHRWSNVIRDTVEEMKQEYIEREVLDKIRADIQRLRGCSCYCSDGIIDDVEDILDKYGSDH